MVAKESVAAARRVGGTVAAGATDHATAAAPPSPNGSTPPHVADPALPERPKRKGPS